MEIGRDDGDGADGLPPSGEGVDHAIDNVGQKYLNFLDLESGLTVQPRMGFTVVTGLRVYTGNDSEERDPATFQLEGTILGLPGGWNTIASGPLSLPSGRNAGGASPLGAYFQTVTFANPYAYSAYRLTFPTLKNAPNANSMQISEIELLGRPPVIPAPNDSGLSWSFNGVNEYVKAYPNTLPTGNSPYTIEAWINPRSMHVGAIVAWGNFGTPNLVNVLALTPSGLINYWWANDLPATTSDLAHRWTHVAATYDGNARRIFVNGEFVARDFTSGHDPSPLNFSIGAANGAQFFSGQIDEVRIWNIGRSGNEIKADMRRQLFGNEAGLVLYYRFDGSAGCMIPDATGNFNNCGTLPAGATAGYSLIQPFAPTVETRPASHFKEGTAILNGEIHSSVSELYYQWGLSEQFGNQAPAVLTISDPTQHTAAISGLRAGATYFFRTVAVNQHGTSFGKTLSFQQPCADFAGLPRTIQLTLQPGVHAIGSNFDWRANSLNDLVPSAPDRSRAHYYTLGGGQGYNEYFESLALWISGAEIPPGSGFFLTLHAPYTLTLRGEIAAGALCPKFPRTPGKSFLVACPVPRVCHFEEFAGFLPEAGDKVFLYASPIDTTAWTAMPDPEKSQSVHTYGPDGWDVEPLLPPGRAAWVKLSGATRRVQFSATRSDKIYLKINGDPDTRWRVEYRESFGPAAWLPLATVGIKGDSAEISENFGATQRFYRATQIP